MDLAAIYALLEASGVTIGEHTGIEVRDALKTIVKGLNKESAGHRTKFKTFVETLGLDPESDTLTEDAKEIVAKAGKKPKPKETEDEDETPREKALRLSLEKLTEKETKREAEAALKRRTKALITALKTMGIKDDQLDLAVDSMIEKTITEMDDDVEEYFVKGKNGKNVSLTEAAEALQKSSPGIFKNPYQGGSKKKPGEELGGQNKTGKGVGPEKGEVLNGASLLSKAIAARSTENN